MNDDVLVTLSVRSAPADPVPASLVRRVIAWLVDYLIVMVPGLALIVFALAGMLHSLPAYIAAVGGGVGWSHLLHLITHHEVGGIGEVASDEWTSFALPLIGALAAVPTIQFGYQAAMLSWKRRTVGQLITDSRVEARRGGRIGLRRAAAVTVVETGLVAVAFIMTTLGYFTIGMAVWAGAVAAFWVNAITLLGRRRRSLVDRIAGTAVIRTALFTHAADRVIGSFHAVSGVATTGRQQATTLAASAGYTASATGRRTSDASGATARAAAGTASAAGRAATDAAAVAGQLAREGTHAIITHASVQHALQSPAGQQALALGVVGSDQARRLGGKAATGARRIGGQAQDAWRQRRAARPDALEICADPADWPPAIECPAADPDPEST